MQIFCIKTLEWLTFTFVIINLVLTAVAAEENVSEGKNYFQEKHKYSNLEIILDHQPIKDNQILYGICNITKHRQTMNCSIILKTFMGNGFKTKACPLQYQTDQVKQVGKNQFQLKLLYENKVLFMWTDHSQNDPKVQHLVFRILDMLDCKYTETKITHDQTEEIDPGTDAFHVVSYDKTFDLFFRNKSLCGDKMCGQTYGLDGKIINGPVSSYIPSEFFQGSTFLCPAKPGTSAKGHYVFSPTVRLVSSRAGMVKEIVDPRSIDAVAVSTDAGVVGKDF